MTFEKRPDGSEAVWLWGKTVFRKYKALRGECAWLRNGWEASVAGGDKTMEQ